MLWWAERVLASLVRRRVKNLADPLRLIWSRGSAEVRETAPL